jgi:copper(I)-binding protein
MLKHVLLLAALLLPAYSLQADEHRAGSLQIDRPWSLQLPPNAPTVAAYFSIHNNGTVPDRLIAVDSPIAGAAQLHEHVHKDGLMKMQQVQAVEIPAGRNVSFAPMAYHVMLLDLKDRARLVEGQQFPLTLHFEHAGDVTVDVQVLKQAPDASTTAHAH